MTPRDIGLCGGQTEAPWDEPGPRHSDEWGRLLGWQDAVAEEVVVGLDCGQTNPLREMVAGGDIRVTVGQPSRYPAHPRPEGPHLPGLFPSGQAQNFEERGIEK